MSMRRSTYPAIFGMLLLAVAIASACQKKPGDQAATPASVPDTVQQARIAEGQRAYLANCAMCHGEWGLGDGTVAPQLLKEAHVTVARLNHRGRLDSLGRDELTRVIERGGAHTGRSNLMPPWGERLSAEEIDRIADFVMALPEIHREIPPSTLAKYLEAPPGVSVHGRKLYVTMCAACHGPYGRGDGRYADTLWTRNQIRPRDLTDSLYFAGKSDRDLFALVSLGGGFMHMSAYMPIWGVSLSPPQIKDLVAYIRSISRTASRT